MTAVNNNYGHKSDLKMQLDIKEMLGEVNTKLGETDFIMRVLSPSDLVPPGFHTIGLCRHQLPEIYVSGVGNKEPSYTVLYQIITTFRDELLAMQMAGASAMEFSNAINSLLSFNGFAPFYQARPVDTTRFMYGQGLTLRYWVDEQNIFNDVPVVQIVWRESDDVDFPVHSTPNQLLLDYVPFGQKLPVVPMTRGADVSHAQL